MDRALRNVVIVAVVTAGAGWLGVWINAATGATDPMQGLGTLVWMIAPAFTGVVLSLLAGNWLTRLGLGFGRPGSSTCYLIALMTTPLVAVVLLVVGVPAGAVVWQGGALAAVGAMALSVLASSAIKNIFEEFAWRGFLTPTLEETRFAGLANHLITGLIWALWHLPYWLYMVPVAEIAAHSGLPLGGLVASAFVMLPLQAILYGELRLATGSVWPAWLLHTVSNVVTFVLLSGGLASIAGPFGFLLAPSTAGVAYSLALAGIGLWLYRRRIDAGAVGANA